MAGQTDQALATLRQGILTGTFPPGARYTETELATLLGMSRTPVREAMQAVAAAGLASVTPRRGMTVSALSAEDMAEIYEVLTALESAAAARLAALDPRDLAPLEAALAAMEHALSMGDRDAWAEADAAFHRSLMEQAGNTRMAEAAARYTDQVHRARMLTLHLRPEPVHSVRDHAELLTAIRSNDPERAHAVHSAHRQRASEMLQDVIRRHHLPRL
ncbi:DNA-binding GntR family transcriptional regulator [Rubricella aquisinus]|uniref:DNA-binding GntR family transcriptional regulator n=1 Tax=Rubricella aquisinus TaxID=2028108 RepID=A0A840WV61_9RHOB|nr:GntR family transcriptional regulator [Rubricella aquisinus]MBB5515090.1 DNA-binding GntR family transcriptional regulator [Rubricella aquisinus]